MFANTLVNENGWFKHVLPCQIKSNQIKFYFTLFFYPYISNNITENKPTFEDFQD